MHNLLTGRRAVEWFGTRKNSRTAVILKKSKLRLLIFGDKFRLILTVKKTSSRGASGRNCSLILAEPFDVSAARFCRVVLMHLLKVCF